MDDGAAAARQTGVMTHDDPSAPMPSILPSASSKTTSPTTTSPTNAASDSESTTADAAVWLNGSLRTGDDARVSVLDHGFLVGDGVFETCGVQDGQPFALTRHLRRLERSAFGVGITLPDEAALRHAVAETMHAAPAAGRLRITVTSGAGPAGSDRGTAGSTVVVTAGPAGTTGGDHAVVVRLPWVRNERSAITGIKSTSYAANAVALAHAKARGASEGLMANTQGALCEATAANVFVERHGELLTPALASGCLAGVTRELILEWGSEAGLPVREAEPDELPFSVLDEVTAGNAALFLTGSVRLMVPVGKLDGVAVPIGPIGMQARAVFDERRLAVVDP